MRYLVVGAGAIGGFVAAQLHRAGLPVTAIAEGAAGGDPRPGLDIVRPSESYHVDLAAIPFSEAREITADDSDLAVLLCVKSHQTAEALTEIREGFDEPTILCLQNGVENERLAARFFPSVYGVCVMLPNVYLEPGLIAGYSDPLRVSSISASTLAARTNGRAPSPRTSRPPDSPARW